MVLIEYPPTTEVRNALLSAAKNRCEICGKRSERLVIDHDHDTGIVRGVLCSACNTGIGLLNDNPQVLRRAFVYVSRWKPDHDKYPVDPSDSLDLPTVGVCKGGEEPITNLNPGGGPGLFRCAVCDRATIKVKFVGRRKGVRIYKPLAHLGHEAVVHVRGPASRPSLRW